MEISIPGQILEYNLNEINMLIQLVLQQTVEFRNMMFKYCSLVLNKIKGFSTASLTEDALKKLTFAKKSFSRPPCRREGKENKGTMRGIFFSRLS